MDPGKGHATVMSYALFMVAALTEFGFSVHATKMTGPRQAAATCTPTGDLGCPCIGEFDFSVHAAKRNGAKTCTVLRYEGTDYCYPQDYGLATCRPWDSQLAPTCADSYGNRIHGPSSPCTRSWCYIDPNNCTSTYLTVTRGSFEGLYYSFDTCSSLTPLSTTTTTTTTYPVISNPSFEIGAPSSGFQYSSSGAITSWTSSSGSTLYIKDGTSAWGSVSTPYGTAFAGLQTAPASLSQAVAGHTPGGTYTLSFYGTSRPTMPTATIIAYADSSIVKTVSPSDITVGTFVEYSGSYTAGGATVTIKIANGSPTGDGDYTPFIDNIVITQITTTSTTTTGVGPPGFEIQNPDRNLHRVQGCLPPSSDLCGCPQARREWTGQIQCTSIVGTYAKGGDVIQVTFDAISERYRWVATWGTFHMSPVIDYENVVPNTASNILQAFRIDNTTKPASSLGHVLHNLNTVVAHLGPLGSVIGLEITPNLCQSRCPDGCESSDCQISYSLSSCTSTDATKPACFRLCAVQASSILGQ